MKKEALIYVVIALVIGVLVGVIYGNWKSDTAPQATVSQSQAPPPPAQVVNYQQQITTLEEIVAREPENRNAWVQLGNTYFGMDQPMKSIEAYDKALALQPDDPNVITDQGVMYRRLGWFDRAIENFSRAAAMSPNHPQSRYNLGVVYRYDLQDFEKAIAAWEDFLSVNPTGQGVEQIRAELEIMKNHPPMPQQ